MGRVNRRCWGTVVLPFAGCALFGALFTWSMGVSQCNGPEGARSARIPRVGVHLEVPDTGVGDSAPACTRGGWALCKLEFLQFKFCTNLYGVLKDLYGCTVGIPSAHCFS